MDVLEKVEREEHHIYVRLGMLERSVAVIEARQLTQDKTQDEMRLDLKTVVSSNADVKATLKTLQWGMGIGISVIIALLTYTQLILPHAS